jgi:hypothetical protein
MSLFNKMFGSGAASGTESGTSTTEAVSASELIEFGRFTDINKNAKQVEGWKQANEMFKNKNYIDSFEQFLIYLRDESVDNVKITKNADSVEFEIIQGSKVIRGKGDKERFYAEASIVIMDDKSMPVMRKLMSINYALRYSKFALKDNTLVLKFSSHTLDASPGKLYDALKELSRKADQQDDLLIQEFSSLKEIDTDSIIELPENIKNAKYDYLMHLIKECKEEIDKQDADSMSGGIAFLLLNLTYQIDYLITPQGSLTDSLEKIQQMFFAQNNKSTKEKNTDILSEFDQILNKPKEKIMEGIYEVNATFAMANPATHKSVMDMMFKERDKVGWYRDNNYPQMVEAIYSYMISYAFFNYGMVYPVSRILNIAMAVLNPDYFESCGSKPRLINDGTLDQAKIIAEINSVISDARNEYKSIGFNTGTLNFTTIPLFIDTLILELDRINLSK